MIKLRIFFIYSNSTHEDYFVNTVLKISFREHVFSEIVFFPRWGRHIMLPEDKHGSWGCHSANLNSAIQKSICFSKCSWDEDSSLTEQLLLKTHGRGACVTAPFKTSQNCCRDLLSICHILSFPRQLKRSQFHRTCKARMYVTCFLKTHMLQIKISNVLTFLHCSLK